MAIDHPAAEAGSVPAAALAADLTPPVNLPAGPPASSPALADGPEPAAALSSRRAMVAVCAFLAVAIGCGVLAVVYLRMAPFWQVISVAASLVSCRCDGGDDHRFP
ncbi:hypothetical protein ACWEQ8_43050 [Streptomyces noursei]